MHSVGDAILRRARQIGEQDLFARLVQPESGSDGIVKTRDLIETDPAVRREGNRRDRPFAKVGGIVAEKPTAQRDVRRSRVVKFDPVVRVIFRPGRIVVIGVRDDFVQHDGRGRLRIRASRRTADEAENNGRRTTDYGQLLRNVMSIATKAGDKGQTGLIGGVRVAKSDLRVEAYGTIDELTAALGFARALCADEEVRELTKEIQRELFAVIGQASGIRTDQRNGGAQSIVRPEPRDICRVHHQQITPGRHRGPWPESEINPGREVHSVEVEGQVCAAIVQLDELKFSPARWLIHHFRHPQVFHQRGGIVGQTGHELNRRRPVAPAARAVIHPHPNAVQVAHLHRARRNRDVAAECGQFSALPGSVDLVVARLDRVERRRARIGDFGDAPFHRGKRVHTVVGPGAELESIQRIIGRADIIDRGPGGNGGIIGNGAQVTAAGVDVILHQLNAAFKIFADGRLIRPSVKQPLPCLAQ